MTVAVTQKLIQQGRIKKDDVTVVAITGNGLKTQEAIQDCLARPKAIGAKLGEFEKTILQGKDLPTFSPGGKEASVGLPIQKV